MAGDAAGDLPQFDRMTRLKGRAARRAISPAWLMLGGSFAAFTVSAAMMHSYTVYLVAFIQDFGWGRGETSIAYSVSQLVAGVSSPLVGAMVDRLGPRLLALLGSVLLVLGLAGSAYITTLWQIVGLYGIVMTVGANCLGLVVFAPMLSRYFVRRRGMAIAIVQSANGIARGVSVPLVELTILNIGWRSTYLVQAALMAAVTLPLAAVFRRAEPARTTAEAIRSGTVPEQTSTSPAQPGWTLGEAVRTPHFWLLFSVYMFTGLGSYFVSLHQLAFAADIGFNKLYAAEVLGTGALFAVPGIVATGTLSDYIGRELAAVLAYGVSIIGVVCALLITSPSQHLMLWLHACFFGVTWGARGPAITAKTADLFPGPRLGTILGVITIGSGLGAALGSWGAGFVFDLTDSYRVAFMLSIASYCCGVVAFWALRRPPVRQAALSPAS